MNTHIRDTDEPMDMSALVKNAQEVGQEDEERILKLRQISNVIQALENLILQCGNAEDYEDLKQRSFEELAMAYADLKTRIHTH